MRRLTLGFTFIFLFFAGQAWAATDGEMSKSEAREIAVQLEIDGPIGPATSDYIQRSLEKATALKAALVVLRMDTPGGLDTSMRSIIKNIIASPVPVVSYVAPSGAQAASAGTYILYASHIAAMAPATNLGAATPVSISAPAGIGDIDKGGDQNGDDEKKPKGKGNGAQGDPMKQKMVNDAVAYIRGLAKMRNRNEQWAEKAVREAASLPAKDALDQNVINLTATDVPDLLRKLDGRKVNVLGQVRTLSTKALVIDRIEPDWRSELLSVITNPNVAYILMLIGIYGLFFEFSNPGAIIPGTVGAICLLLALFAFQVLPVNYAGFALVLLGLSLMIAEMFVPSVGILGLGGVVAFVIGSVILMDTDAPGFGISLALVGGVALSSALFFFFAVGMLLRSRKSPVVSGVEELIGSAGIALDDFSDTGTIRIHGEIWNARTDAPLRKGEKARIRGLDGLILLVTPQNKRSLAKFTRPAPDGGRKMLVD